MKKQSIWSMNFSTAALVLIPAAIGVNYLGKLLAELLKSPLWLDSIGTRLSSMLTGPIIGALTNIIYEFTASPVSFVYAITLGVLCEVAEIKSVFKKSESLTNC